MSGLRIRGERGSLLPLVAMAALMLFAVLSFAIDQSTAYVVKTHQENALDAARSACMDASFALVAKNSEDPGRDFSNLVCKTVRGEGFAGRATVWFYEAPAGLVSDSERLWVVGLQLEERAPTVFAQGFGIEGIPVASHRVVVAVPYAAEKAWRPRQVACGRFETAAIADGGATSFVSVGTLDGFPEEMVAAVKAALPEGSGL